MCHGRALVCVHGASTSDTSPTWTCDTLMLDKYKYKIGHCQKKQTVQFIKLRWSRFQLND